MPEQAGIVWATHGQDSSLPCPRRLARLAGRVRL